MREHPTVRSDQFLTPPRRSSLATAAGVLLLLVAACGSQDEAVGDGTSSAAATETTSAVGLPEATAPPSPAATTTAAPPQPQYDPAPELTGVDGWINSEPTTIAELNAQGRVVLIDFWTYTCINCIRTFPYLRDWHEKYSDLGLTILGVHAPEFEFEQKHANVLAAVERYGIEYPVVQDNQMATWRAYENLYWPAKYLVAADGTMRYQHFGEGGYVETERAIRAALEEAGHDVSDIPLGTVDRPEIDEMATIAFTRELYGGYGRGYRGLYAAQEQYYLGPDREVLYEDPGEHVNDVWYLQGLWRNEQEAIVHARVTEDLDDYIALRFFARSVNVVLEPVRDEPFEVIVELDGRPLRSYELGDDVVIDDDGRSVLRVDEARMYAIVEVPAFGRYELKLRSNSDNFAVFAFTFGVYLEGP